MQRISGHFTLFIADCIFAIIIESIMLVVISSVLIIYGTDIFPPTPQNGTVKNDYQMIFMTILVAFCILFVINLISYLVLKKAKKIIHREEVEERHHQSTSHLAIKSTIFVALLTIVQKIVIILLIEFIAKVHFNDLKSLICLKIAEFYIFVSFYWVARLLQAFKWVSLLVN